MTVSTQIQWINGNNLGTIYSSSTVNSYFLPAAVYDPQPYTGPVTYSLIGGSLPDYLTVDSTTGYIWGTLTNITSYETKYFPTIQATKTYSLTNTQTSIVNTFELIVRNYNQSSMEWVTPSNLTIPIGTISDLKIQANILNSTNIASYVFITGELPAGLSFNSDGTISGIPQAIETKFFSAAAEDINDDNALVKLFGITVVSTTSTNYTNIYLQPLLSLNQRSYYQNFITNTNTTIFDPSFIYRPLDVNFGVQNNIRMVLEYGIQELDLSQYMFALQQNFQKRKFTFGNVKCSTATDNSGNLIYDAVYVEIVDTSNGAPLVIYDNNNIYYPATIDNMRTELSLIEINSGTSYVGFNNSTPLFMNTYQQGQLNPPKYIPVLVICYALPGYGQTIVNRINDSEFDFKLINFEIDRIYIQNVLDSGLTKYLLLPRENITSVTPEDNFLFGPDDVEWIFDDNDPITLE